MSSKIKKNNSIDKSLKVVVINPPTEKLAVETITRISNKISKFLSSKLNESEER